MLIFSTTSYPADICNRAMVSRTLGSSSTTWICYFEGVRIGHLTRRWL